jgi:hypothetical protein
MLQWIAALEKVARESHYTGRNRFDSFAPIRLNVAAQWLVDGVSIVYFVLLDGTRFDLINDSSATTFGIFPGRYFWPRNPFSSMIGG